MQTVLLVEDSRFLRIATQQLLVKAGYNVVTAADGEEALRVVAENHTDVILLDMMLPKVSGLEVLRHLKADATTVHIPVIILTGLSRKNEANLRRDGAAGFVEKDSVLQNPRDLLEAIAIFRETSTGVSITPSTVTANHTLRTDPKLNA